MRNWQTCLRRIKGLPPAAILFVSILLLMAAVLVSLCLGAAKFTPVELIRNMDVLRYIRVPRVLAAVFAGAGLAGTGVIIQTLLGNSLAGPNIIGVNSAPDLWCWSQACCFRCSRICSRWRRSSARCLPC